MFTPNQSVYVIDKATNIVLPGVIKTVAKEQCLVMMLHSKTSCNIDIDRIYKTKEEAQNAANHVQPKLYSLCVEHYNAKKQ